MIVWQVAILAAIERLVKGDNPISELMPSDVGGRNFVMPLGL
jgi:hypothetical protein